MRLFLTVLCISVILSLGAVTTVQDYRAANPTVHHEGTYDRIQMDGSFIMTVPGAPEIPVLPVKLLLPPGEKAVSVTITTGEPQELPGTYKLYPIQTPVPTSQKDQARFTEPNLSIYNSSDVYPQQAWGNLKTQYYRGHSIALVNLYPVRYIPSEGKLLYYPNLEVHVESAPDPEAAMALTQMYRGDDDTNQMLVRNTDNPSVTMQYPAETRTRDNVHYYLFIVGAANASYITPLVNLKIQQGYNPLVVTTAEIYANTTGTDNADKIRTYIKNCYTNEGVEYVALCGDVDTVPTRGLYVAAGDTIDDLPSDLYYEGLDRVGTGSGPDWNTDNDSHWGEDGESDYYPEIAVGRLSGTNATEFTNLVNKQISYEQTPVVADLQKALMVGECLNTSPLTYGGNYKDQIVSGGTFDGHTTAGISNNFTTDTMYERDQNWDATDLKNQLNQGYNLVNHLGHSNTDYNMKFYLSDVTDSYFTVDGDNHNFYLIYSQGCYAAAFDDNSIAEKFCKIAHGCVVYVGNSRYGWYMPGGTNSSSQYLDREFFDAFFGEGITKVSDANNDSKIDGINQVDDPYFRWAYYELNVFGDPTLDIWTSTPQEMTVTYPTEMPVSQLQFTVQTGVANALVGVSLNGVALANAVTNSTGSAIISFSEPFTDVCTLDLFVTAHNYQIYQGQINVIAANGPYIVLDTCTLQSGDDNVVEFGENASISLTLRNIGTEDATALSISASTLSNYITFTDNQETGIVIPAGETVTLSNIFAFTVADVVPDASDCGLIFEASDGANSWSLSSHCIIYSPILSLGNMVYADGGDGILESGESTDVQVYLENAGGADAENLQITLTGNDPLITLDNATASLPLVDANGQAYFTLHLNCSNQAPDGYLSSYAMTVNGEHGLQYTTNLVFIVGTMFDGFETGDFGHYNWDLSGDVVWRIVPVGAYQGMYCARSGDISDSQSSTLSLSVNVLQAGPITFRYKVSCQNSSTDSADYLFFAIDGVEQARWDGIIAWAQASFPVTAGQHTFTWTYTKNDDGVSYNSDCGWIDSIQFPTMISAQTASFMSDPTTLDFGQVVLGTTVSRNLTLYNLGTADMTGTLAFDGPFTLTATRLERNQEQGRQQIQRDSLSFTVPSAGVAAYTMTFQPVVAGDFSGNLIITSNDPFHQYVEIPISAVGTVGTDDPTANACKDRLAGNYPNPFNPSTTIAFSVQKDATPVKIEIYNARGQKVTTLLDTKTTSGQHLVRWQGTDQNGHAVASGIYLCRAQIGDKTFSRRMVMVK